METLTLRNGAVEAKPLVLTTMMALRSLMETDPISLFELATICRDPRHRPWGATGAKLFSLALLEANRRQGPAEGVSYRVHDSVRNVVLSATEGEGLALRLISPLPD